MSTLADKRARYAQQLAARPYAFDLFAVMRRIQALNPGQPRLGRALRPAHEPLRVGQRPYTNFAPSTIAAVDAAGQAPSGVPKLEIYSFGLFGPNGPLPLAFTEHACERQAHYQDRTLAEFADLFHHRLALLFFRAWADAQAAASLDRVDEDDGFSRFIASLLHAGLPAQRNRGEVGEHARLGNAGHLVRQVRNAEGLERILSRYFGVPVVVREFVAAWLEIPQQQRARLGGLAAPRLGGDAVIGAAVLDRQHRFELRVGPMSLEAYRQFLPGGRYQPMLLDWVRRYVGIEYIWRLRLVLAESAVPDARLAGNSQLGWTSWLGRRTGGGDRDDLVLDLERPQRRDALRSAACAW